MAVLVLGSTDIEEYLRVRFYQVDDHNPAPIEAVYCKDFFAEKIAAEADYA